MGRLRYLALASLAVALSHSAEPRSALDRLSETRLEAVHQARLKWMRDRVVHPPLGIYRDFRAVIHVHAEDAAHTLGTRNQVLEAAQKTDVKVVMWTDHRGPKPDAWSGMHGGVLFIPGSEDADNVLRFPKPGDDLRFLSHLEEKPGRAIDGFAGQEIYNRHTDAELQKDFTAYLKKALDDPKEFKRLADKQARYPDEVFAAATGVIDAYLEHWDAATAKRPFTGIAANDAHRNTVLNDVVFDPYEVSFRHVSTHILARELKEDQIRASLREGHVYVSHDWLCDPSGFAFVALNNLGLFDIGDRAPMIKGTTLAARFPVPARARIIHNGAVVHESTGAEVRFTPKDQGAYRLEAWLNVDGEDRPWIFSNPIYIYAPDASVMQFPASTLAPNVKAVRDLPYTEGKPEDAAKHKLDLYLPSDRASFPVVMFVHGGSWRSGDRSLYPSLGNRLAKAGIGVVIPSYRLAPKSPPPAQIEDVAAAWSWTRENIGKYGGDAGRLYLAGHSAGGHLVSELALDPKWLAAHQIEAGTIKGVAAFSGVYDVSGIETFGPSPESRRQYSPINYVHPGAPPFLVTYCQWDYPNLGPQAVLFDTALRKSFVESTLTFIPRENHISEMLNFWKDDDPSARALIEFIKP